MALKGTGTKKTFAGGHHGIYVSWTATQNQEAISSTVVISVHYWVEQGWSINKGSTGSAVKITVNGTTYSLTGYIERMFATDGYDLDKVIATKTVVVPHDQNNGTASLSLSASVDVTAQLSGTWYYTQYTTTNTWTLDTIEVYYDPVASVNGLGVATAFGEITVNWTVKCKFNAIKVRYNHSVTGSGVWLGWTDFYPIEPGVKSGSYVYSGLLHNTRYTFRAQIYCEEYSGDTTGVSCREDDHVYTWGMGLADCDITTVEATTMNSTKVHVTKDNPHKSYMTLDKIIVNDTTEIIREKSLGTGTNAGYDTLTEDVMMAILAAIPNASTCTIKYGYSSYTDSTKSDLLGTGTTQAVTLTLSNVDGAFSPSIDSSKLNIILDSQTRAVLDANGYSNRNDISIADLSTIEFVIPQAAFIGLAGSTMSTIASYSFTDYMDMTISTGGGTSARKSGTDLIITLQKPIYTGTIIARAKIKDSRGFLCNVYFTIVNLKYQTPSIEASMARDADVTSAVHLADLQVKWSNITGEGISIANNITIKYGYKENSATAEVSDATTVLTGYPTTTSDDGNSFAIRWSKSNLATNISLSKTTFVFAIFDTFGRVVAVTTQVRNSIPIFRMLRDGRCSINCGVTPGNILTTGGNVAPSVTNEYNLGDSNNRWKNLYLTSASNIQSDERLKENFTPIGKDLESAFMEMEPVTYTFRNNETSNHDRVHMGFKAQQLEATLSKYGYPMDGFALVGADKVYQERFDEDPNWINPYEFAGITPEDSVYNVAYIEMIPLLTHMIQRLMIKTNEQQKTIDHLKSMLESDDRK